MNAFGVHGCSVVTALTAQNTLGVQSVEPVSEAMLRAQIDALMEDLPPAAIKTGMLGSAALCRVLAAFLDSLPLPRPPLICDPVLQSSSGTDLLDRQAFGILMKDIFPKATIITPNLPETERLVGSFASVETAAERLLEAGAKSVLIKGGHARGDACRDYWTDGTVSMWLASPRVATTCTHGTGCILSSAIASAMALCQSIPEAVVTAKTLLNQCLKSPARVGAGRGPMMIRPFEDREEDRPEVG
jgi:hydroxymethylpyrimidine kinase/phosphomethylpyrimidine kinase/thiamine-phosphate diphosphorylase